MKSYNNQRIGRSPYNTANTPNIIKWRFAIDWVEAGGAISANGTIYVGSGYYLYAVNPDGTQQWRYKTGNEIFSDPAIATDGTIYFTSTDSCVYALNPNGTLKWDYNTWNIISSSPVITPEGNIIVGNSGGRVFEFSPSGYCIWSRILGGDIYGSPALGPDGTIYFGSWNNNMYALAPNGTIKWSFATGNHVKGIPSVAPDGTLYFGSWDGYLYALYPNGTMRWRCRVGSGTETTPVIASDGTIYVGGDELYAVYPNGTLRWAFNLGTSRYIFQSCPAVSADGIIYVGVDIGDSGGEILAVNPNGTERWRHSIATFEVESSPIIAEDGTIYIGCANQEHGCFYAFGNGPVNCEANGPYSGYYQTNIQFNGDAFGGIPPYTYHWDFGDGNTSDQQNPTHSYSTVGTFTATLTVHDSTGNHTSDTAQVDIRYELPTVAITRPTYPAIYLFNVKILPLTNPPLIIGPITVKATANQYPLGIQKVEFSISGVLKATVTQPPYEWTWKTLCFKAASIEVTAYDSSGKTATDHVNVYKIG